jgi:hypothetical protein
MADEQSRLIIPGASWEMIKKIVRAYHAVDDRPNPSVDEVAAIAGKARPVISSSNNFLRAVGLLKTDENKLTPLGIQFATGLSLVNQSMEREALQQIIRECPPLARLVATLRARGSMKEEALRGQVIIAAGLNAESRNLAFVPTILDLMEGSGLIEIDGDTISVNQDAARNHSAQREIPPTSERETRTLADVASQEGPIAPKGYIPTPFPLGPNRLAYLSLPGDWSSKELPKLLKMIELAFGEAQ